MITTLCDLINDSSVEVDHQHRGALSEVLGNIPYEYSQLSSDFYKHPRLTPIWEICRLALGLLSQTKTSSCFITIKFPGEQPTNKRNYGPRVSKTLDIG